MLSREIGVWSDRQSGPRPGSSMTSEKTVLTTGDVARICNVAPRTVSKWFDSGQLRGYRIPGSKDRRIPLDQLIRFMRLHGMPLNGLDTGKLRVVVVESDVAQGEALAGMLQESGGFEVSTATSTMEAGALAYQIKPHVMVIDVTLPDVVPVLVSRWVHAAELLESTSLIGIGIGLTQARGQALKQEGFDGFLSKPFEGQQLVRLIEELSGASVAY